MANLAGQLQSDMKSNFERINRIYRTSLDLISLYNKGSVLADITASAGTDPVTESTRLTKDQVVSIFDLANMLRRFLGGVFPPQGDYVQTVQSVQYGEAIPTKLTEKTEAFGNKGVQFAREIQIAYERSVGVLDLHEASEIDLIVAAISPETTVYGSDITAKFLEEGITLTNQFVRVLSDNPIGAQPRIATVAAWVAL